MSVSTNSFVLYLVRAASALPDALTASFFMVLWVAPELLWPQALRTGLLMMLVEFILLQGAGMLGGMVLAKQDNRAKLWKPILGFGAMYFVFIVAWSWQFQAWWPVMALGWLLVAKLAIAWQPLPNDDKRHQMASDWAVGTMAYLAGVAFTTFLPIPKLGLTHAVVMAADLPGESGHWLTHPQSVVVFGVFYFGVLALVKLFGWRLPAKDLPAAR